VIRSSLFRFCIGLVLGLAGALLLGELFSRFFPPADLQPFLGDVSKLTGIYRPDPAIAVAYRSVDDFRADYRDRLKELEIPGLPRRTWLWFGSSFVQAPGMLGDLAQSDKPDVRMFYLRRNAWLPVRVAQLRVLLEDGMRPERVIFVLVPMDVLSLARKPLDMVVVNSRGAITYRWRPPPLPLGPIVNHSHLALLGWLRSGGGSGNPSYQPNRITEDLPASLRTDLTSIFRALGQLSTLHHVPITVVLLPNREQIFGGAGYNLQDFERSRCEMEGIDCFDTREEFAREWNKMSLFVSDWHFSERGNRLILDGLYSHWQRDSAQKNPR